nr:hypothetical protein [Candidatus Sigynarchaeum springense]
MEDDKLLEEPINLRGLLDVIIKLEPAAKSDSQGALLAFIDKLYRAACIMFDQHAEPRGFASPTEERAAAVMLTVLFNVSGGLKAGFEYAIRMYLDILEKIQRDPVYAHYVLVKKSTIPLSINDVPFNCEAESSPASETTREPRDGVNGEE